MSTDNGVYILETYGPEFRVKHLQEVDNVYWDDSLESETDDQRIWLRNARRMWGDCDIYEDEADAWAVARNLLKSLERDGVVEYGVSSITINGWF